ncbi:pectate lyase [Geofilum rubicundum JCM 15548]|uniref:Pectate lyase n=2 Tax=Geofilum TaxID=1236988 RepID=A0A0E9LY38_9BACT|nr:pectate lyase [Geofilum rubicundum JCM 15548]
MWMLGVLMVACNSTGQPVNGEKPLAFPGAEGAGKYTVGGRGGEVYVVTNLKDEGEGSLRKGVQKHGARTIVFAVSGTILLNRPMDINNDSITIAGQTAPGDGICLQGYGLNIKANEVIVRYLRIRPGDIYEVEQDAVSTIGRKNIIIDHCSMSWGNDEVLSAYNIENLTVQWCLISESLNESHHHKGEHGYGGIWGGHKATFHHNLLAHHTSRNPRFQGGRSLKPGQEELVEMVNNVIYNYAEKAAYAGEAGQYNMIANYFKPGPATSKSERRYIIEPYAPLGKFYLNGNVVVGAPEVTEDNSLGINTKRGSLEEIVAQVPFSVSDYKVRGAEEAYEAVLTGVGASHKRDVIDQRVIAEVREGTATYGRNGILDSQEQVGGWPDLLSAEVPLDGDGDGMPDTWEEANGLNSKESYDHSAYDLSKHYTNLEVYMNSLVDLD